MSPMRQWIRRNSNSIEWIEIQAEMLKYVVATENKTIYCFRHCFRYSRAVCKLKHGAAQKSCQTINKQVPQLVKFPHSPILHYVFSSWIEKTMTKTVHRH